MGVRPFVMGDLSLLTFGAAGLLNVGGGVDYWRGRRSGLLFEIHDDIFVSDSTAAQALLSFRFGIILPLKETAGRCFARPPNPKPRIPSL